MSDYLRDSAVGVFIWYLGVFGVPLEAVFQFPDEPA